MRDDTAWVRWGRYAAAAMSATVVVWFAFVAGREVPVLDPFDLAIHEIGHVVMIFAPRTLMFLAGSVAQVAVPLAFAWYFGVARRDAAGGGFCLAWAGASAWDVSVYIADAPVRALPLIGSGEHDWAYLLGPGGFNVLHLAGEIAGFVEFVGAVVAVTGIGIVLLAMVEGLKTPQAASVSPNRAVGITGVAMDPWLEAAELPFKHVPLS